MDNTATGYKALLQWLAGQQVVRVGLEASGGYERGVVAALREAGLMSLCCSLGKSAPLRCSGSSWPKTTGSMRG